MQPKVASSANQNCTQCNPKLNVTPNRCRNIHRCSGNDTFRFGNENRCSRKLFVSHLGHYLPLITLENAADVFLHSTGFAGGYTNLPSRCSLYCADKHLCGQKQLRSLTLIVVDDPTKYIPAFHRTISTNLFNRDRTALFNALMWPCLVEIGDVFCQHLI